MPYYVLINDETKGPYTMGQLRGMWNSGAVTAQTLHCQEGYDKWTPLSVILDQLEPTVAPPPLPGKQTQQDYPSASQLKKKGLGFVVGCIALLFGLLAVVIVMTVITDSSSLSGITSQENEQKKTSVTVRNIKSDGNSVSSWITGEVVSQSSVHLERLQIQFNLYDSSGAKVGTATDHISDLEPGGVWRFKATVWEASTKKYVLDQVTCKYGRIY